MAGPATAQRFHPSEVARAYRQEHPRLFDDVTDAELIDALKTEEPGTYALVDPTLIGAEMLAPGSSQAAFGQAPPPKPRLYPSTATGGLAGQPIEGLGPVSTLPVPYNIADTVVGGVLRTGPPLLAGGLAAYGTGGNPWAVAGASSAASGMGETAAQWFEKNYGNRESYSPGSIAFSTALGAVNPAARGATMLGRTASQVGYGAGLGLAGTTGHSLIEQGQLPGMGELATSTAIGGLTGGLIHGGFEAAGAAGRAAGRATAFTGELGGELPGGGRPGEPIVPAVGPRTPEGVPPMAGGPPIPPVAPTHRPLVPPDLPPPADWPGTPEEWTAAIDTYNALPGPARAPLAAAVAAQYQAEEAALAQQMRDQFGPDALRGARGDLHTALTTKAYLERLAALSKAQQQLAASLQETLATTFEPPTEPLYPPPPGQLALPRRAGPSAGGPAGPFTAYPPGVAPPIDLLGVNPAQVLAAGPDLGAGSGPPPTLASVIDQTTAGTGEPGPPRLAMTLQPEQMVAEPPPEAQRSLPIRPRPQGPLQQTGTIGGAPPTREQPRLPGIERPAPGPPDESTPLGRATVAARAARADTPAGISSSVPSAQEVEPSRYLRRQPGEPFSSIVSRRDRYVREQRAARGEAHDLAVREYFVQEAQALDPSVDLDLVREAYDARRRQWEAGQEGESGDDPRDLLREIARRGGVDLEDTGAHGEVRLLAEGQTFGRSQGVPGVFRKGGRSLESLATDLTREDPRYRHFEEDPNTLFQAIDAALRHQLDPEHVYLGTGEMADALGIDSKARWWEGWDQPTTRAETEAEGRALDDPYTRDAREATDAELRGTVKARDNGVLDPDNPHVRAAAAEAVRRGLIDPEQGELRMEGPGGEGGPKVFDFEGEPPPGPSTSGLQVQRDMPARQASGRGQDNTRTPASYVILKDGKPVGRIFGRATGNRERGSWEVSRLEGDIPRATTGITYATRAEAVAWAHAHPDAFEARVSGPPPAKPASGWGDLANPSIEEELALHEQQRYSQARDDAYREQMGIPAGQKLTEMQQYEAAGISVHQVPPDWVNQPEAPRVRGRITGPLPEVPYSASMDPARQVTPPHIPGVTDQPELPGTEGVRDTNIPTPEVAEAPFALTPPPEKPPRVGDTARMQQSLWDRLKNNEGVLILKPPPPNRRELKAWLKSQEEEHGGERWYSRVETLIEQGELDRAWKAATAASVRSAASAYAEAKTPRQEALIARALRGTALQDDLNTQIVATGRRGQIARPEPTVAGFPSSQRVGQTVRGAEIGPAGILNLGPPQQAVARGSRAETLDREIVDSFIDAAADHPDLIHLIRGNRDSFIQLGRQVADLIAQGQIPFDYANFPGMTRYEAGRQYMHALSEAGRILGRHGNFVQEFRDELYAMNDRFDIGAAKAGSFGGGGGVGGPPPIKGARGRTLSPEADRILQRIATDLNMEAGEQAALANDLRSRHPKSVGQAAMDTQYAFLTAGLPTAIRNAESVAARYSVELLDDLITAQVGKVLGGVEPATARFAGARARERAAALVGGRRGWGINPRRTLGETFEEVYNLTPTILGQGAKPNSVQQTLRIFASYPVEAAHLMGSVMGEDLTIAPSKSRILNALGTPRVQRWLQIWNRSQEFPLRALAADTNFRAQLRARGLDPAEVLANPDLGAMARRLGGREAVGRMLYRAAADAREMTYAGGFAKNSIPGWAVHMVSQAWPAKLAVRFPGFNFARAPRWIYDHGPWALMDLVRLPFDRKGWTSTGEYLGGGRLHRGLQAAHYESDVIPMLRGQIVEAEGRVGDALQELSSTSAEFRTLNRQVDRLQARAQAGLPDLPTAYEEALAAQQAMEARRSGMQDRLRTGQRTVADLRKQETELWKKVQNATGISAPTYASWIGRMSGGTLSMLGAAVLMRSSKYADGTRYDQLRLQREDGTSWNLEFSALAPLPQFMFVADVMVDFERHTDWAKVWRDVKEESSLGALGAATGFGAAAGSGAGPLGAGAGAVLGASAEEALKWNRAVWNNYQGKYTPDSLGADFGRAMLSISRAAGTTLTIAELMSRNGWPGLQDVSDAAIGTIGQFLAGWATPLGQVKDLLGTVSEEEATVRNIPRTSSHDPASASYPLAAPLARIPFANRLLPPAMSQTTGKPITAEHPGIRLFTGVGGAPSDAIQEMVRRTGVPGSSVYIRETGDVMVDTRNRENYARYLQQYFPVYTDTDYFRSLSTPALQRDFLQRTVFPNLKRAALATTRSSLPRAQYGAASLTGEAARRQLRQQQLLADLEGELGAAPLEEPEAAGADVVGAPPPPGPASLVGTPPPAGP